MKELIMKAYEGMYDFREGFVIAGEVVKEKLEAFYADLGYKAMDNGIRGKFWESVLIITAGLNFILCLPFIPAAFVLIDLPFNVLRLIIYLNHWDEV